MSNPFNVQLLASGVQPGPEISPSLENHFSRRKQFFLSLSVSLSPFFTSCGSLISIEELYNFLANKLGGVKKTINYDGEEFQAIILNDGQRMGIEELWDVTGLEKRDDKPAICRHQCIDKTLLRVLRRSDPTSTGTFVTKYIGRIEKKELERALSHKTRTLRINPTKGSALAEAFVGSQLLKNDNIIKPSVFFLARYFEGNDGRTYKGVYSMSPYEGFGDLNQFVSSIFLDPESPVQAIHHSWNAKVPFLEAIMAPIIKGALMGLKHMHDSNFVHGDFKLENVIVCEDREQQLGYTGKLIDFGLSCEEGTDSRLTGTYCHLAPESAEDRTRKNSLDFWALGANLFWLFTDRYYRYFENFPEFRDAAINGELEFNSFNSKDEDRMTDFNLSKSLKELIKMLLVVDPEQRPNCDEILKASWFKECDEVINQNKVVLENAMKYMVRRSRPMFSPKIRRASKRIRSKEIKTSGEDPVVPLERAYLSSPNRLI